MRNRNGFSLIELLLVVAVILIISAIAVPNFLRSRQRANEASAVASLRVLYTAPPPGRTGSATITPRSTIAARGTTSTTPSHFLAVVSIRPSISRQRARKTLSGP